MPVPMSTSTDWYCSKERVAHFTGRTAQLAEISDFTMDTAFKWVNSQLAKEEIDASDVDTSAELSTDPNIEQAHMWYACYLMTQVIDTNQHHARDIPDNERASMSLGQGEVSTTYHKADPSEHYAELSTPNYYFNAQRSLRDFLKSLIDPFTRKKKSLIAIKNTLYLEQITSYAHRLWTRRYY